MAFCWVEPQFDTFVTLAMVTCWDNSVSLVEAIEIAFVIEVTDDYDYSDPRILPVTWPAEDRMESDPGPCIELAAVLLWSVLD